MERDYIKKEKPISKIISTHTLTWSVTDQYRKYRKFMPISTHTLTWSVTNSPALLFLVNIISTHTLTWSVTR